MEVTTTQKIASQSVWTKKRSVTRPGKFYYTANISPSQRMTVCLSSLSNRWLVRENERELPTTWATAKEAKDYAEASRGFGRFAN